MATAVITDTTTNTGTPQGAVSATPATGTPAAAPAATATPGQGTAAATTEPAPETTLLGGTDEAAADPAKPGDAKPAEVKPAEIEYADFTLPAGIEAPVETLTAFKGIAKELKLDQAGAQKLVDFQVAQQQAQMASMAAQRQAWQAESKQKPNHAEELMMAKRGLTNLVDVKDMPLITESWLGDHPVIIKMLAKAGRLLSEHGTVPGTQNNTGATGKGIADRMFGK